jgi:anti-sigma regulatory factor (Ser/Thr protein kinase)
MIVSNSLDACKVTISNQLDEINNIFDVITMLATKWKFSAKLTGHVNLAIEEVVSNIINYAYNDGLEHEISIQIKKAENALHIEITDDGKFFNIMESVIEVDLEAPIDERKVGGLGIYLTNAIVDHIEYQRIENKNVVTLTKIFNN